MSRITDIMRKATVIADSDAETITELADFLDGPRLVCPECGAPMVLRTTDKHTYKNGLPRKFYGCSNWPECNGTHGAHPDGSPLGTPANQATKNARINAHAMFDRLWQGSKPKMTRKEAYRYLQRIMGMTKEEAHIGHFTIEQCQELIERLR